MCVMFIKEAHTSSFQSIKLEMCMPAFLCAFVAATMCLYHNKDWKKTEPARQVSLKVTESTARKYNEACDYSFFFFCTVMDDINLVACQAPSCENALCFTHYNWQVLFGKASLLASVHMFIMTKAAKENSAGGGEMEKSNTTNKWSKQG